MPLTAQRGANMGRLPFDVAVVTEAQATIRAWIKANRESLEGLSPEQVAYMAVTCGFDLSDVCSTLVDFYDAMQGSHLDNRGALQMFRNEYAWNEFHKLKDAMEKKKQFDLMPYWKELAANTTVGSMEDSL